MKFIINCKGKMLNEIRIFWKTKCSGNQNFLKKLEKAFDIDERRKIKTHRHSNPILGK